MLLLLLVRPRADGGCRYQRRVGRSCSRVRRGARAGRCSTHARAGLELEDGSGRACSSSQPEDIGGDPLRTGGEGLLADGAMAPAGGRSRACARSAREVREEAGGLTFLHEVEEEGAGWLGARARRREVRKEAGLRGLAAHMEEMDTVWSCSDSSTR